MSSSPTNAPSPELLEAARGGDEEAFSRIVERYRGELHAHCYRMLGSLHDTEDALQDALLRAWRGLANFKGRDSIRPWLYKIATNACLDVIARRPKRVLPVDYGSSTDPEEVPGRPIVESVWIEPYPDELIGVDDGPMSPEATYEQRESVELAFTAALQHLPPRQRAVLIMREVLGFSAQESADTLETTVQSVNSALQRARSTVEDRLPEQSQQATLRELGDDRVREIVEAYMDAMERGDVKAVVGMLSEDAAWSMPPLASWYHGREALQAFLVAGPLSGRFRWKHVAARANGQAAFGAYTWHPEVDAYLPFALNVLDFDGDRVKAVTSFIARSSEVDPDWSVVGVWPDSPPDSEKVELVFERFGLPVRLTD